MDERWNILKIHSVDCITLTLMTWKKEDLYTELAGFYISNPVSLKTELAHGWMDIGGCVPLLDWGCSRRMPGQSCRTYWSPLPSSFSSRVAVENKTFVWENALIYANVLYWLLKIHRVILINTHQRFRFARQQWICGKKWRKHYLLVTNALVFVCKLTHMWTWGSISLLTWFNNLAVMTPVAALKPF